jgi:hypothetical protein
VSKSADNQSGTMRVRSCLWLALPARIEQDELCARVHHHRRKARLKLLFREQMLPHQLSAGCGGFDVENDLIAANISAWFVYKL